MSFATDEEIRMAHDALLKGKSPFDNDRVNIIKEDSSCYVQACPGSGKTTTLLAKLLILANRMPLPEGKGVCVLTHTNVAIDEIKAKVGQKADVLFRYPNFFGTIQSFLHKYITSAALHYYYGSQIAYVDDDIANAVLLKKFSQLPFENKLKKLVFAHTVSKDHPIDINEINAWGGENVLLDAKVIKKKGKRVVKYDFQLKDYELGIIPENIRALIRAKKQEILKSQGKEIILSFRLDWVHHKIITDNGSMRIDTPAGSEYVRIKDEMFSEGVLSFDDAYDLAFRYIQEKGLDFSSFSDRRFRYLFIDEVQDCNNLQMELIKRVFADDKVIVQRFGDYCQAIFDGDENDGAENQELKGASVLHVHNSNRFGEKIARPLRTLCMEDNHQLVGNGEVPSLKPIIITYENPLSVLPKYEELLGSKLIPEMGNLSVLELANKEKDEDPLHRVNVKACGWVGRKDADYQKRFIESYYPAFERKNAKTRLDADSFNDFICNPHRTVKDYATSIMQGILKFLDLCDVKNGNRRYTITSLLEFLATTDPKNKVDFLNNVMNWALLVAKSDINDDIDNIKTSIYQYITGILLHLFGKEVTSSARSFFNASGERIHDGHNVEQGNIYHGNNIDIEVATVHSVKGETHISTLYMETFYKRLHESERLAEQFKGVAYTGSDENMLRSLRVAYVGMSRSRYLLCVAVQKDRFEQMNCPELREIWDVEEA